MKSSRPSFLLQTGLVCASLAALFAGGCKILPEASSDPTRYYVLSEPAGAELLATKTTGTHQIGLRPVELPGYLHNHKDMVVRTGANELRFQEFALWAEPLEAGVNRVLKQRLLSSEAIGGVSTYPFSIDIKRDFDVVVRVLNCEGFVRSERSDVAHFVAAYDIIAPGGQVVVRRTFTAPEQPWDGKDFGTLARLLSDDLAKLAEDIAANLPK